MRIQQWLRGLAVCVCIMFSMTTVATSAPMTSQAITSETLAPQYLSSDKARAIVEGLSETANISLSDTEYDAFAQALRVYLTQFRVKDTSAEWMAARDKMAAILNSDAVISSLDAQMDTLFAAYSQAIITATDALGEQYSPEKVAERINGFLGDELSDYIAGDDATRAAIIDDVNSRAILAVVDDLQLAKVEAVEDINAEGEDIALDALLNGELCVQMPFGGMGSRMLKSIRAAGIDETQVPADKLKLGNLNIKELSELVDQDTLNAILKAHEADLRDITLTERYLLALEQGVINLKKRYPQMAEHKIQQVFANMKLIVNVNDDIQQQVHAMFASPSKASGKPFFGFNPKNIVFVNGGYNKGFVNGDEEIVPAESNKKESWNHGYAFMELSWRPSPESMTDVYLLDAEGNPELLEVSPFQHVSNRGALYGAVHRVNDLILMYPDMALDAPMFNAFLNKVQSDEINMMLEMMANPSGQKGGLALSTDGKMLKLVEGLAAKDPEHIIAYKVASLSHSKQVDYILKSGKMTQGEFDQFVDEIFLAVNSLLQTNVGAVEYRDLSKLMREPDFNRDDEASLNQFFGVLRTLLEAREKSGAFLAATEHASIILIENVFAGIPGVPYNRLYGFYTINEVVNALMTEEFPFSLKDKAGVTTPEIPTGDVTWLKGINAMAVQRNFDELIDQGILSNDAYKPGEGAFIHDFKELKNLEDALRVIAAIDGKLIKYNYELGRTSTLSQLIKALKTEYSIEEMGDRIKAFIKDHMDAFIKGDEAAITAAINEVNARAVKKVVKDLKVAPYEYVEDINDAAMDKNAGKEAVKKLIEGTLAMQMPFAGAGSRMKKTLVAEGVMLPDEDLRLANINIQQIASELKLDVPKYVKSIGFAERHMLALEQGIFDLKEQYDISDAEVGQVFNNMKLIVSVSEDIETNVINMFTHPSKLSGRPFFGLNPENLVFVKGGYGAGYTINADGSITANPDHMGDVTWNHGFAFMELAWISGPKAYTLDASGNKVDLKVSAFQYAQERGAEHGCVHRINDLILTHPKMAIDSDMYNAFLAKEKEGYNLMFEMMANPTGQKGGMALSLDGKHLVLLEGLAAQDADIQNKLTEISDAELAKTDGKRGVPYNRLYGFYSLDAILGALTSEDMPFSVKMRDGMISPEIPTGDITQMQAIKGLAVVRRNDEFIDSEIMPNPTKEGKELYEKGEGAIIHDMKQANQIQDGLDVAKALDNPDGLIDYNKAEKELPREMMDVIVSPEDSDEKYAVVLTADICSRIAAIANGADEDLKKTLNMYVSEISNKIDRENQAGSIGVYLQTDVISDIETLKTLFGLDKVESTESGVMSDVYSSALMHVSDKKNVRVLGSAAEVKEYSTDKKYAQSLFFATRTTASEVDIDLAELVLLPYTVESYANLAQLKALTSLGNEFVINEIYLTQIGLSATALGRELAEHLQSALTQVVADRMVETAA